MKHAVKLLTAGVAFAAMSVPAFAADLAEPQIIETPVYQAPERVPAAMSGWYIRGDVGYSWNDLRGVEYTTYPVGLDPVFDNDFVSRDLKGSFSVGAGVGYQINHWARVDATLDYDFKSDFEGSTSGVCQTTLDPTTDVPCSSSDTSSYTALTLMANAYVDLGTYSGFTPYVGAGIGGAYVKWSDLDNTIDPSFVQGGVITHEGSSDWRFAYALMAGVSYDINHKLSLDLGYRYKHIQGGHMFGYANNGTVGFGAGPGYDEGITQHTVRAGLRYKFGGGAKHKPAFHQPAVYK